MVEEISDTIQKKLKEICNVPEGTGGGGTSGSEGTGGGGTSGSDEYRLIIELLEKTSGYNKQTKSTQLKKEFQLLVDQYFPYKADEE